MKWAGAPAAMPASSAMMWFIRSSESAWPRVSASQYPRCIDRLRWFIHMTR
jgi:hypothetical protein